jgi:ATP-grasp domain
MKNSSLFNKLGNSSSFFIKLFNWEYWSFGVVYAPIYFYWFYLCVKCRSLFFFSAANPTITNGGFLMERKSDINHILPKGYYPKSLLIEPGFSATEIEEKIHTAEFNFPLIVKPDIGGKGRGVKKITSLTEATTYIKQCNFPMLVQEYVDYENEVGVFYVKLPHQGTGFISGVVQKSYLIVEGDSIHTVEEILLQNPRFRLQMAALKQNPGIDFAEILPHGVSKTMLDIGNHARGSKFEDITHKVTPLFTQSFNTICNTIPHFYFGRLDIRYKNWDDLANGKNLSIIELNGAGSEPTHMYDPAHSIFFAWKEIAKHLYMLAKISRHNKKMGIGKYLSFKEGITMFKENSKVEKILNSL